MPYAISDLSKQIVYWNPDGKGDVNGALFYKGTVRTAVQAKVQTLGSGGEYALITTTPANATVIPISVGKGHLPYSYIEEFEDVVTTHDTLRRKKVHCKKPIPPGTTIANLDGVTWTATGGFNGGYVEASVHAGNY